MSKMPNRTPVKMDSKGSGDIKRDSSTSRSDRNDKSHSHSRSESSAKNKHDRDVKEANDGNENADHKSTEDKKFTGRCRLFVGNLTSDITEDDFKKLFSSYGEVSEVYVNSGRGFGFIRMDYRQNAEAAKAALDGLQRKGRVLRVRFATHAAALRVKHLHPYVSNELLEQAFAQFGEIERAVVIVDERGKSTGEGLVEFTRKPGAQQALRRISEGVFLFGVDPKPIEVEPLEHKDEEDGLPEKLLTKNDQYKKEREKEPHFAPKGSFEFEFGMRWKQLAEMEKKRIDTVKQEMEDARLKLEDEMQNALYEYQAEQIRQDLVRQQEELRRLEELRNQDRMRRQQELEMRSMSRRAEEERERQQEERRRQEMMMRQQEMQRRSGGGSMDSGMPRSRDEMMAMRGEGGFPGGRGGDNRSGAPPMQPPPAPPSGIGLERGGPQGMPMERGGPMERGMGMERGGGGPQGMGGMERGGARPGMGMDRGGPQGMGGMERGGGPGPQGMGGMERGGGGGGGAGVQGMGMDRGGQGGMGMERGGGGGQQAMSRMQQGGGGQGGGGPNPSSSGSPSVNMGGQGGGQMSGPSRFDQKPGNQFEPGFGNRGGMGGPGGNQGGPGGMGGAGNRGGMGGPGGNQPVPLFQQMPGGMGRPGPDRGMMDRRREAPPPSREEMEEMKRMRRF